MPVTYSNPRREAVIADWPYGGHRTTATFSIETTSRGERGVRVTVDPKRGRPTAPKKLTFARKARIVTGDDGLTYIAELTIGHVSIMHGDMRFQAESIFEGDPRYAEVRALFDNE